MKNSNRLKNNNAFIGNHRQIDDYLYHQLRGLQLVANMDSLSTLCGKTPSYYRSMKAKHLGLKLGSLAMLREHLSVKMEAESNPQQSVIYGYGMKAVEQEIRLKVQLQQDSGKSSGDHDMRYRGR